MLALKKAAVFLVLITGTLLLTACPSQTNIAKINADPIVIAARKSGSRAALPIVTA